MRYNKIQLEQLFRAARPGCPVRGEDCAFETSRFYCTAIKTQIDYCFARIRLPGRRGRLEGGMTPCSASPSCLALPFLPPVNIVLMVGARQTPKWCYASCAGSFHLITNAVNTSTILCAGCRAASPNCRSLRRKILVWIELLYFLLTKPFFLVKIVALRWNSSAGRAADS